MLLDEAVFETLPHPISKTANEVMSNLMEFRITEE